jgi:Family of unknown function (DUF6263)
MSSIRLRRRPAALLAILAPLALALGACGDDDDSAAESTTPASAAGSTPDSTTPVSAAGSTPDSTTPASAAGSTPDSTTPPSGSTAPAGGGDGVEVLDPGSESGRIELPGTAEVGQSGTGSATISIDLAMEGPGVSQEVPLSLRIDTDAEVVDVTDSGYVAGTTIRKAKLLDAPADLDPASIEAIAGVTYRQEFAADGTPGEIEVTNADELSNQQLQAFDEFASQLNTAALAYPPEPVGVGARWKSTQPVQGEGFDVDITYEYELTAIEGDTYTVEIHYDQDIDDDIQQGGQSAHLAGTVTGGGTTSGSVANPLLVNTSIDQNFDVDIESDGDQIAMTMDVSVELKSTGG